MKASLSGLVLVVITVWFQMSTMAVTLHRLSINVCMQL